MDKRIIISFLALILLLGVIIGIRMLLHDCKSPEIEISNLTPETGELVHLRNITGDKVKWYINDKEIDFSSEIKYAFKTSGKNNIKAIVNEKCETVKEIDVKTPCEVNVINPTFSLPSEIEEDVPCTIKNRTENPSSVSWFIEETKETYSGNSFTTVFNTAGKYKITLKVSGKCFKGDTTFAINVKKQKNIKVDYPIIKEPVITKENAIVKTPVKPVKTAEVSISNDFITEFINKSNLLYETSEGWSEIVTKFCSDGMVEMYIDGALFRSTNIEKYRKIMINGNYKVLSGDIINKQPSCIKLFRVNLEKL